MSHAGIWQDEQRKKRNEEAGHKLCARCEGTGNELYAMWRACKDCEGLGIDLKRKAVFPFGLGGYC